MPLLLRNVSLNFDEPEDAIRARAAHLLKLPTRAIRSYSILRRSLDARKSGQIRWVYHLAVALDGDESKILRHADPSRISKLEEESPPQLTFGTQPLDHPPVIIGCGPAGLFAALTLAEAGYRPILLERGQDATARHRARHLFYTTGEFDPENNLLFGIGGAGTYSDGKLYSRTHDPRNTQVLQTLVRFGADPDILINSKPHIGSDRLPGICRKIVKHIIDAGGQVRFGAKVVDIETTDIRALTPQTFSDVPEGRVASPPPLNLLSITLQSGENIPTTTCILAVGYSARDTYKMLAHRGVQLLAKPFQMGVRIEHPQDLINKNQFGPAANELPPADYHLIAKNAVASSPPPLAAGAPPARLPTSPNLQFQNSDLWTFCMCPGGIILPSNESPNEICTNGASNAKRNSPFANSGLVVTIHPDEFQNDPFAGIEYQRRSEALAYKLSGSYAVPAQRANDFLNNRTSNGDLKTSYPLGSKSIDLRQLLPKIIITALERGLPMLNRKIPGYASDQGIITAPETRASSPVRIPRDEQTRQSLTVAGIYPVGEGAGYSGGIMSSATDGIKSAETLMSQYAPLK